MAFKDTKVKLETYDDRSFKLLEDLVYEGKCGTFTVPAGFVTDFASVPAMVQWLIPSYGKYALAAIVHDYLCVQLNQYRKDLDFYLDSMNHCWPNKGRPVEPEVNSRDTDGIFRRIMRELGVPPVRRWVMWTGVRWGALASRSRRRGIYKDLPLVLLWSLIAAPIVVPASILAGIGLAIDKIVEKITGVFE